MSLAPVAVLTYTWLCICSEVECTRDTKPYVWLVHSRHVNAQAFPFSVCTLCRRLQLSSLFASKRAAHDHAIATAWTLSESMLLLPYPAGTRRDCLLCSDGQRAGQGLWHAPHECMQGVRTYEGPAHPHAHVRGQQCCGLLHQTGGLWFSRCIRGCKPHTIAVLFRGLCRFTYRCLSSPGRHCCSEDHCCHLGDPLLLR